MVARTKRRTDAEVVGQQGAEGAGGTTTCTAVPPDIASVVQLARREGEGRAFWWRSMKEREHLDDAGIDGNAECGRKT